MLNLTQSIYHGARTSTAPFVYKGPLDPTSTSLFPRLNGVLLPLKSHIQWRKRSGYPLPLSRAASVLAPHLPPFYWHVISWRSSGSATDRHTIYDWAKQTDRSSGPRPPRTKTVNQRVSQHHDSHRQAPRHAEETPATTILSRITGHPDCTTDVRKKQRENVDLRARASHFENGVLNTYGTHCKHNY